LCLKFPYSDEQVGKGSLPVPREILESPPLIQTTLLPGNILYMPRGFVHQAKTLSSDPSFHATVAVATHDWTLARTIPTLIQKALESIPKYRMAMPLWLVHDSARGVVYKDNKEGEEEDRHLEEQTFEREIEQAMQHASSTIQTCTIIQEMSKKIRVHNSRAESTRLQFQQWWTQLNSRPCDPALHRIVGSKAARQLSWNYSIVRAATMEERSFARDPLGSKKVGLTVRDESREALLSLLAYFNANTTKQVAVSDIRSLISPETDATTICDFTLLCFVKCCVELGSLAIVLSQKP